MDATKSKNSSRRRPARFLVFWTLGWILAFVLSFPTAAFIDYLTASYTSIFPLGIAVSLVCYALLQRVLLRRYLQIDARRWVSWTALGVVASLFCYLAYDSLLIAPQDPLYFVISGEKPGRWAHLAYDAYQRLPFIMMLGLPILFQLFALPRRFSNRWLWIIAAFASGSLWYASWEGGGVLFKTWPLLDGLFTRESAIHLVWPFAMVEILATPMLAPGILLVWLSRQAIRRDNAALAEAQNAKTDTMPSARRVTRQA